MKHSFRTLTAVLGTVLALTLVTAGVSHAISIDETITKTDGELSNTAGVLDDQTITFTGLNPNPTTDATMTFRVNGDFDSFQETITLTVDSGSYNFGIWLNNDFVSGVGPGVDDTITGPVDDIGEDNVILTGTATVPLATFQTLVADGELAFLFDYSATVVERGFQDLAEVRVQYDAQNPIPEPSTMLLFGTSLVGLAAWRWRTRKQT